MPKNATPRTFIKRPIELRQALADMGIPPTHIAAEVGISPTSAFRITRRCESLPSFKIAKKVVDHYHLDQSLIESWPPDEVATMISRVINFSTAAVTVNELANLIGCDRANLYSWKHGKTTPTYNKLGCLCATALKLQNNQISRMPSFKNLVAVLGFNTADLENLPVSTPTVNQATIQYLSLSCDSIKTVAAHLNIKAATLYSWRRKRHSPQVDKLRALVEYTENVIGDDILHLPAHDVLHAHIEERLACRDRWS